MLVIRRRAGEAIVLNGETEIEVIEISRTRVKLGVRAPREVTVTRRESVAVADENRKALELLATQGTSGVHELVNVIRNSLKQNQILPIRVSGDTAGIGNQL